jgi:membrane-bound inhibitor of C-type lysozyme
VFKRTGTTWAQEAYLKPPNAGAGDGFGFSVSVSSDTIVVGANQEDSNQTTITNGTTASADNSASASGAVYVFKRTGTTWAQEAYLKAPNAEANDFFGNSVSVSSDTIVVGANNEDSNQTTITNGATASADNSAANSGAVYVFRKQ